MSETTTFVRRTTTVETLPEAWAFIMGEVDRFTRPSIEIQAVTEYDVTTMEGGIERYAVTVYGDVSEETT